MPSRKPNNPLAYISLSPDELQQLWINNSRTKAIPFPRVIEYDEIIHTPRLTDVFSHGDCVILFYPNHAQEGVVSGHYVSLIRTPHGIIFYDSYGGRPDTQKQYAIQRNMLYQERNNSLVRLMLESGLNVDYNNHKHQSTVKGVATCGLHSLNRCFRKQLSTDQYNQLVRHHAKDKGMSLDDLVVDLWGHRNDRFYHK